MSVTPPPTYEAPSHPQPFQPNSAPHHPQTDSAKQQLTDASLNDVTQALEEVSWESIGIPRLVRPFNVENPATVNPFNYTGNTFGKEAEEYEFSEFLPSFPKISYPPLEPIPFTDRGHFADASKSRLFSEIAQQGGSVSFCCPAVGADIKGVSLKKLSKEARDDLALFISERGVVFFRDQHDLTIEDQADLGRHWGPLHIHNTTGVPKRGDLPHVHVVYADQGARPDVTGFAKHELYHSDVTYEIQPPGPTILKLLTGPAPGNGGDTMFTSCAAVYSSLSPFYQEYLEKLSAVHSGKEQARGAQGAGQHVRRPPIETVHPVVRVHPVTGLKSIFINAGFTRRIVGVPKAESDNVLQFLNAQFAQNADFSCRMRWNKNDVAIWDNRVVNHSALFDFWPERRHALRITPHAEKPLSVAEYEAQTGKKAKDWLVERYRAMGVEPPVIDGGINKKALYFKD